MALNTVQAVLLAQVNRLQELEDAGWTLLDPLSDPTLVLITGDLLDKIGSLVGESRQGRGDTEYQAAIRIRIRVNRSRGTPNDIIAIAVLASINSTPRYFEFDHTCTFEVDIDNLPGAATVARLLGEAKPVGVRGTLVYSVDALDAFEWGDSTDGTNTNTAEQFADSVGSTGPAWPSGVGLVSS